MERIHSFGVTVQPIERSAQIEPTFRPRGALIQRLFIERGGLGRIAVQSRFRAVSQIVEVVIGLRGGLSGRQTREQQACQEKLHAFEDSLP